MIPRISTQERLRLESHHHVSLHDDWVELVNNGFGDSRCCLKQQLVPGFVGFTPYSLKCSK